MLKFVNTLSRIGNTACIGFIAYQVYDFKYHASNPYMDELDKVNEYIANPDTLPKFLTLLENTLKYYYDMPKYSEMLKDYPNIKKYMFTNTYTGKAVWGNKIDVYKYHITFKGKEVRINGEQYELDDNDKLEVTQDNGDHISIKVENGIKYVTCKGEDKFKFNFPLN